MPTGQRKNLVDTHGWVGAGWQLRAKSIGDVGTAKTSDKFRSKNNTTFAYVLIVTHIEIGNAHAQLRMHSSEEHTPSILKWSKSFIVILSEKPEVLLCDAPLLESDACTDERSQPTLQPITNAERLTALGNIAYTQFKLVCRLPCTYLQ